MNRSRFTQRRVRRGAVLLEVLVSMVLLGLIAITVTALTRESLAALDRAAAAERAIIEASDFLQVVSLWPADELEQRLGERAQGPWRLRIARSHRALFTVSLIDTTTGAELLRTALYRGGEADARR